MAKDIEQIKNRLMIKYPLFGGIIANVDFEEKESIPTACTDGKKIWYNSKFVSSLNENEQVFLFAHEICHIAFDHIARRKDKNEEVWNTASDAVINSLLKNDGLPLIEGAINIEGAVNYTVEEMYEKIINKYKKNKEKINVTGDKQLSNKKSSSDKLLNGHASHEEWGKECSSDDENENLKEEIKKVSKNNEQDGFNKNKKIKKEKLSQMMDSMVAESYGEDGNSSNNMRKLDNIGVNKELIDWRLLLKEATKVQVDWSYKNASIEEGVVMANLEEFTEKMETEILLDVSGSVSVTLIKNFLRECKNIINTSKIKVGCFDSCFYGFKEIKCINDIDNITFPYGGGTSFSAAIKAFSDKADNKIVFTDGLAYMPSIKKNIIWVVFGDATIKPLGGKVIYIRGEQLKKMMKNNNDNKR